MALRPAATQIDSPFAVLLKFRIEVPGGKHYLLCAFLHHYDRSEYLESIDFLALAEARFYAAQILCALDCLHDLGIMCGRLQPSNLHIDFTGYLFLGDFDLYVRNIPGTRLPWPQPLSHDTKIHRPNEIDKPDQLLVDGYLVRELLAMQGDGHDVAPTADWYSFGAILHQLLTGRLPYNLDAANNADTPLSIPIPPAPNGIPLPQPAEDLLAKFLSRNPSQRLGANGSEEIKSHPFFDKIDWPSLLKKEYIPGFRPPLVDERAILLDAERPCREAGLTESRMSSEERDSLWATFSPWLLHVGTKA